ncbi:MAG: ribbon-helix-helix protein, CopG family [Deltaproteobacteria bacterium]
MPTSVHIPKPLLAAVDRKARVLRISRNRLIIQALEHAVEQRGWSPGFFDQIRGDEPATNDELRRSMEVVVANRKSKRTSPL